MGARDKPTGVTTGGRQTGRGGWRSPPRRQRGALTLFTGLLVLILMTLMLVYATRVSQFESRVSANDLRQKMAFGAAETSLAQGVKFIEANNERITSTAVDAFPDGNGGTTGDGWLAPAPDRKWAVCATGKGPCDDLATGSMTGTVYYYDADNDTGTNESIMAVKGLAGEVTGRVSALMCVVDKTAPLVNPTTGVTACEDVEATAVSGDDLVPLIWVMGYGFSDCTATANPSATCTGYAAVTQPMASFEFLSGTPPLPWTTKTVWPPSGNVTVVGRPDAGGVGLTGTVWANCNDHDPCVEGDKGSWQTCELQEWYGLHHEERPEDVACPQGPSCNCNRKDEHLSDSDLINIDIIQDPTFPDDLFFTFFGVARDDYNVVKQKAQLLEDCDTLNEFSSGLYWTSNACKFNKGGGNKVIGSPTSPVILVAAGPTTELAGTVDFFGVLYIFDGENPTATLTGNGTFRLYGAGVADLGAGCTLDDKQCGTKNFNGNFHIVYNDGVVTKAAGISGFGGLNGGWRDFGVPEIAW